MNWRAKNAILWTAGGLSWQTTSEKLQQYFENYGAVSEAFVSYDKTTGRPRGFGFVIFESPEIADKVVAAKHTIDRREVRHMRAKLSFAACRRVSLLLQPSLQL